MSTYHHGNLRKTLLQVARQQLVEHGPEKLSLRALARATGVSQTAPYRHFSDKKALLAAMAAEGFKEFSDAMAQVVIEGHSPEEQLIDLAVTYLDFARNHRELFQLMFGPVLSQKQHYADLQSAGLEGISYLRNTVTELLKVDSEEAGDIIWTATLACWSLVHGLASLQLADTSLNTTGSIERKVLRLIITGLAQQSANIE